MNGGLGGTIPPVASEVAQSWDSLYYFLFGMCVFFFVLVVGAMILFSIKYRAREGVPVSGPSHNAKLEVVWTILPTILVMVVFVWGWIVYNQMSIGRPTDAMEVKVLAKQWNWTFQYDDGKTETDLLVVPVNKPVKLVMTSNIKDVLHSFFVPNLRIKKDVVPGHFTYLYFKPTVIGTHQIFCAEYCGTSHSDMLAKLIVVDQETFNRWRWGQKIDFPPAVGIVGETETRIAAMAAPSEGSAPSVPGSESGVSPLVAEGKRLMSVKGCVACHSDDGSPKIGPTYKGIFGHEVELTDGSKVLVDENYIRESIFSPQAKIVKGFETMIMPPYAGQINDQEILALIEYIKSVR